MGEELETKYQKLVGIVAAKEMLKEGLSSHFQGPSVGDQKKHICLQEQVECSDVAFVGRIGTMKKAKQLLWMLDVFAEEVFLEECKTWTMGREWWR